MLPDRQIAAVLRRAEQRQLDVGPQPEWVDDPDHSELERRFLALCRRHGLPSPEREQVIGAYTVDFVWRAARVVVEVDGYGSHGTRAAFESDRARDVAIKLRGFDVIRFTWRQVAHDGPDVASTLRAVLAG